MIELLNYVFIQNAITVALLSSIVCGIIGTIIVEKRLVSMSGGIAHTSFGGIGLGYLLGIEPLIGGMLFAILAAFGITSIKRKTNTNSDTLIGMFWSVGMALGIIFIEIMPGYPPDLTSYLFGDILQVSKTYIYIMFALTIIILISIISIFNYWKAYLFDEDFTKVIGINTVLLEKYLYILISLSIVVLIKVVGIILVIVLLTVPPAITKLFTYNLSSIMIISIIIGIITSILGLFLSFIYDIPSGATIILLTVSIYIFIVIIKNIICNYKIINKIQ